jgi:hypothetical protein
MQCKYNNLSWSNANDVTAELSANCADSSALGDPIPCGDIEMEYCLVIKEYENTGKCSMVQMRAISDTAFGTR